MSHSSIERKLIAVSEQIRVLQKELGVIEEQLVYVMDTEDDARLRSIVTETPVAVGEHREATKAVAAIRRDREARMNKLAKLESKQDALLDRLSQVRS